MVHWVTLTVFSDCHGLTRASISCWRFLGEDRKQSWFCWLNTYRRELVFCLRPSNKAAQCGLGWSKITMCKKTSLPKIKTMLTLFFDNQGVVRKEIVPEGQMVTKEFYLNVLGRLLKWIACETRGMVEPQFQLFPLQQCTSTHHNNCAAIFGKKKKIVPVHNHPAYSLDLTLLDYFVLPKLKMEVIGDQYKNISESRRLWQQNWNRYLFVRSRKQWNDIKIAPKSVFVLIEIILKKELVLYVFVLFREVFEE